MYCCCKIGGNKNFDISELFRCYFNVFFNFFSMFYLSILCLFYIFAFLCLSFNVLSKTRMQRVNDDIPFSLYFPSLPELV